MSHGWILVRFLLPHRGSNQGAVHIKDFLYSKVAKEKVRRSSHKPVFCSHVSFIFGGIFLRHNFLNVSDQKWQKTSSLKSSKFPAFQQQIKQQKNSFGPQIIKNHIHILITSVKSRPLNRLRSCYDFKQQKEVTPISFTYP